LVFPKPLCRISGVNHLGGNLSNSSDVRLSTVFEAAERYFRDNALYRMPIPTTPWIGPLAAKVKLEPTEFLGKQGFVYKSKFRKLEFDLAEGSDWNTALHRHYFAKSHVSHKRYS